MVRHFVAINGVKAPVKIQEECVKETADHFSLKPARVKEIIKRNTYMLLARDTIVGSSPSGKAKLAKLKSTLTDLRCFEDASRPLYEHQIRVTKALQSQRELIIVHDVGSGKTLTAVTAADCFLQNNPSMNVIVVTPVSLVENFKEEIIRTYQGRNMQRYTFYTHAKFAKDLKTKRLTQDVIRKSMVIIDEVHNYRTKIPKGAVSGKVRKSEIPACFYVQQGIKSAQKVLGLTATPFVNDISDLITIVSIVTGKDLFAKSRRKITPFRLLLKHAQNLFSFYEIEKGDPRFPSYTIHKIELVMPSEYYTKYMEIEKFKSEGVQKKFSKKFYGNIRLASNKIDNKTDSPKVLWTINKVQSIVNSGGRVVVYSGFIDSGITLIRDALAKKGIGCSFITGKIKRRERSAIVKDYNAGRMPVLLISKAGGEGLDLKQTTAVIMLEPTWNGASRTQIFGRGIRNGSHLGLPEHLRHVDCYILLMVKPKGNKKKGIPSGDKFIYNITEDKQIASDAIMVQLAKFSLEKKALTRWVPQKQNYHIIPPGNELPGIYEDDEVEISEKTAEILEEIAGEESGEDIGSEEFFDLDSDDELLSDLDI
jgi:hypothetical protein